MKHALTHVPSRFDNMGNESSAFISAIEILQSAASTLHNMGEHIKGLEEKLNAEREKRKHAEGKLKEEHEKVKKLLRSIEMVKNIMKD